MKSLLFGCSMCLSFGLIAQDLELYLNTGQKMTYGVQTVNRLTHNNGNLEVHVQGQSPVTYLLTDVQYFNYKASTATNVSATSTLKSIRLYPNPAKEVFTLDLLSTANARLELYDLQGKLVHTERLESGSKQHSLQIDLQSGLYVLKVRQGKETFIEKIRITK